MPWLPICLVSRWIAGAKVTRGRYHRSRHLDNICPVYEPNMVNNVFIHHPYPGSPCLHTLALSPMCVRIPMSAPGQSTRFPSNSRAWPKEPQTSQWPSATPTGPEWRGCGMVRRDRDDSGAFLLGQDNGCWSTWDHCLRAYVERGLHREVSCHQQLVGNPQGSLCFAHSHWGFYNVDTRSPNQIPGPYLHVVGSGF